MSSRSRIPAYRLHKQNGQAVVTLTDGQGGRRDVLLGKHDTPESRQEHARVLSEWEARGRRLPAPAVVQQGMTINELMLAYWRHVEEYYVKDGQPTSEQGVIKHALRFLKQPYGHTLAQDFGPLALKAVRQAMVDHAITRKVKDKATGDIEVKMVHRGLTRRLINKQVGRLKRMFAWAVEEELLSVTVYQALRCVKGLKKGKGQAREKARIGPVPDALVEAVLPLVQPTVRAMIEVQRLCGGRPQDIVQMRAIEIDMTGPVWEYRPRRYKAEHHNEDDNPDRERIIFLGPRARAILRPHLPLRVTDYIFSPLRASKERPASSGAALADDAKPGEAVTSKTKGPSAGPLRRDQLPEGDPARLPEGRRSRLVPATVAPFQRDGDP
jgi:hypothetical protein